MCVAKVKCVQLSKHITDQSIQYISSGCHRLEYLCLSMCPRVTDRSLQALSLGCQLLKDLEVAGCSLLTDSGFYALAKNCHDLERMDLEDCSLVSCLSIYSCGASTDCCCHFQSLSHCELITDEGMRQLSAALCLQDRLTVLELDNCPLLTDAALEYLARCKTITRVELYDCQLITRSGIRKFKQQLPSVMVHAYFAPATPPVQQRSSQYRYCRCCAII
ncbi:unnamed protein product [Soboliphyme baturini]|uniref:F-box domain-containing protein n=1 Tax=Soboliphyme baturini TaxID=241478 RepID=A0A183IZS9_9BILA|nr:unnamed protein product [Soboliphyme baturini]